MGPCRTIGFLAAILFSLFGLGRALAASSEDFDPSDLSSDEHAVIGNVKVWDGEEEITSRCRICFRADLSECFELGSSGSVQYKRKGGSQRVTSMSCSGKEPDRVAVRGFIFAVDPRPGVATYFGSLVLKGSFSEKLFQVDSVADHYSDDVNPFHKKFGNKMAVRYVRSLPSPSFQSILSKETKASDESPISAALEKERALLPKRWYVEIGVDAIVGTKYTDSSNVQSLVYDQKSAVGYSRSQLGLDSNFYWVLSDARNLLLGAGLVYAHDELKTSTFNLTQNLTGIGPSVRYYFYGQVTTGAFLRSELGLARRSSTFSGTGVTASDSSGSGGYFSIGVGGDLPVFTKVSLGVSANALFDNVKNSGEREKSRRFLLGIHVLF